LSLLLSPQIQAFIAVAEHKSVHQAAFDLHITQTAVTQRLRTLEAKLNLSLFVRSRRGMLLTPEGESLLRYAYAARSLEDETLLQIQHQGRTKNVELTLCGPTSIMSSRVIPACFQVMRDFPNLLLHFDITDNEDRHQRLREGRCQFAIIQPEHLSAEMQSKPLRQEQYVLVCTTAWQGRELAEIIQNENIIDYNPDDQTTFNYLKQYDLFNRVRHERHFVNRTESIAMMIAAGHGYGLLTREFCQSYIDEGSMLILNQGKIFENQMVLAYYPRPFHSNYFASLIQHIE
jgi:DNA-binding transcriptional LysR family regulator